MPNRLSARSWFLQVACALNLATIAPFCGDPAAAGEPHDRPSFEHAGVVAAWKKYADRLEFGSGQTLALVDDGCTLSRPEWAKSDGKAPKVRVTHDSVDGDNDPSHEGRGYHGTTIGFPSSLNYGGKWGVAYNNQVAVIRGLECCHCRLDDHKSLAAGLQWIVDHHKEHRITTVNLAPVDDQEHGEPVPTSIDEKLTALRRLGVWVSAPAGNHNFTKGISWPACQPGCFAIGAVRPGRDEVYLDRHAKVDLVVPAAATSSSNAIACGAAIVVREAIEKTGYDWKHDGENLPEAILALMQRTGPEIKDAGTGRTFRRLDLCAALDHVFENAPKRPNVVFLLADDMRADSIAALGNPAVRTPNLDALVARGFVMRNAYCFGGNSPAVCTPSRNMLLSGNAYFRWKGFLPPGAPNARRGILAPGDGPNFADSLRNAGYLTYHHGKRGNTAPLIEARFEIDKRLANDEAERRSGEPGREIVDEAIRFLQATKESRPLFLYLAFANPHDPRVAAATYLEQYDREKLPLPRNFLPFHPFDNGELTIRDERLLPWPRTERNVRQTLHEYYATVTALDFHIGRLIAALKESGRLDNTIVIFSADQGIAIGSHGLLGKQNLYDHSMKAPLILAGPGIPQGASDALVYLLDLHPTVCDLVGAKVPAVDGRSFRPALEGKKDAGRPELMLAYRDSQRAIRDERWKLIRYPAADMTQLFDLETDPHETRNLARDDAQKDRVEQLLKRLSALQKSFDDDLPLTAPAGRVAPPVTPESLNKAVGSAGQ